MLKTGNVQRDLKQNQINHSNRSTQYKIAKKTQLYMEGMIIQNLIYLLNTCKRKASKWQANLASLVAKNKDLWCL